MNFIAVAKKTVQVAVQIGVAKIVSDIIESNVEIEKARHKVAVPVASFAVAGVVAEAASNYTDALIDEMVDFYNKIKNRDPEDKVELKVVTID